MQPVLERPDIPVSIPAGAWQTGPWLVHELASVTSTNWVAASLPAWQAVRADVQTAGRGRFQRTWISDRGGLWLSAVLPIDPAASSGKLLALGAGLAVCEALRACGVSELRLRWPNDVLVQDRKLAGILIDQFVTGLVVVGIGVNVTNRPAELDPTLSAQAVTLRELLRRPPSLKRLTQEVLRQVASMWAHLSTGPGAVVAEVNRLWQLPRQVQLDLDGQILAGEFEGIDVHGRLQLRSPDGQLNTFEPHQVRLLRDLQ